MKAPVAIPRSHISSNQQLREYSQSNMGITVGDPDFDSLSQTSFGGGGPSTSISVSSNNANRFQAKRRRANRL